MNIRVLSVSPVWRNASMLRLDLGLLSHFKQWMVLPQGPWERWICLLNQSALTGVFVLCWAGSVHLPCWAGDFEHVSCPTTESLQAVRQPFMSRFAVGRASLTVKVILCKCSCVSSMATPMILICAQGLASKDICILHSSIKEYFLVWRQIIV